MQGIVVVNKPKGWSSFDVVKKIKRLFNTSKVGHLGTLDPMAEGVLPVAIGKATKLFDLYLKKQKVYIAEMEFGYETDTLDAEGEIIQTTNNIPTPEQLTATLTEFIGKTMQTPPKYSAVKINGKRAYLLARENKEFEIGSKEITISSLELLELISPTKFKIAINCGAGTYIRSLVRDIAYKLGSVATMTKLVRVQSGNFSINDARTIAEIENNPKNALIPTAKALENIPRIELKSDCLNKLINGIKVRVEGENRGPICVYVGEALFGIGEIENNFLKINARLYEGENND